MLTLFKTLSNNVKAIFVFIEFEINYVENIFLLKELIKTGFENLKISKILKLHERMFRNFI